MYSLYQHYTEAAGIVDMTLWPNFSMRELSCPCCGEFYYDPASFDAIQMVRNIVARPIHLNSAHRCPIHNSRVGGSPASKHKLYIAFDISLRNFTTQEDKELLYQACLAAGFIATGFYGTFLHVDLHRTRRTFWMSDQGEKTWSGITEFGF